MNQPILFAHDEFGRLGVLWLGDKLYFPATECATILGYANPYDAIMRHCRGVVKHEGVSGTTNQHGVTTSQSVEMNFIPEGDLYRLIVRSKLPSAERFERWVFDEVLPSIRATGGYKIPQTYSEAMRLAADQAEQIEAQQALITQMTPKAEFYDTVTDSTDAFDIGVAAKILNMGIGRNTMFKLLRDNGVFMQNNLPYQEYIDRGYFRVIEQGYQKPDGSSHVSPKTLVYQKGIDYMRRLLVRVIASGRVVVSRCDNPSRVQGVGVR